jgi:hypothetical protein
MIKAGTGISRLSVSFEAGQAAAIAAVRQLGDESPALVLVFTTPKHDLPALIGGVRSITGDATLVGATGSGEIVQGEYLGFGEGVGVLALTSADYRFGVASAGHIRADLEHAGQTLASTSQSLVGKTPYAAALMFTDSLLGDLQQFFHGVYRITGPAVPIVGAGAGDEQKFERTVVFHNDTIVDEGAVLVWIGSEHPLRVSTMHGWQPIGVPMIVTRALGTELVELGGRPAAQAYEEQLGIAPGALKPEDFWGTSILHPLGLIQPDGSTIIRVARSKTAAGTLRIQACVPPTGSAVQVMRGSVDSLLSICDPVVRELLNTNARPGVVLTFSCAARATIFGGRVTEEPQRLQRAAGATPIFGFYCCAEFARTSGVLGTHNATLTAIAL